MKHKCLLYCSAPITGGRLKALTKDSILPLESYNDCLNAIICSKPSPDCYLSYCSNCPNIDVLRDHSTDMMNSNDIENVIYSHWISNPRTSLETTDQFSSDVIQDFCDRVVKLLPHSFIAKQQSAFTKTVKNALKEGEFVLMCDFAEKYGFVVQNAAPGFHWNNNQAAVYPMVIYYKSDDILHHKSLVVISDFLKHDAVAVYIYSRIGIEHIKTIHPKASKIYYFSDGAPQQFKNYKHFSNVYYHEEDFGVQAE